MGFTTVRFTLKYVPRKLTNTRTNIEAYHTALTAHRTVFNPIKSKAGPMGIGPTPKSSPRRLPLSLSLLPVFLGLAFRTKRSQPKLACSSLSRAHSLDLSISILFHSNCANDKELWEWNQGRFHGRRYLLSTRPRSTGTSTTIFTPLLIHLLFPNIFEFELLFNSVNC